MRTITRDTQIYRITDVIISYLVREYIELFESFKSSLLKKDELNILGKVNDLYSRLVEITNTKMLELAQLQYEFIMLEDYDPALINNEWLLEIFENFNPITKYVYSNEIERKRSRMYEGIMSSEAPVDEIETSLRHWCSMVNQMAIDVTDNATTAAYISGGVIEVMWVSEDDEKRCDECEELDGQVFPIDEAPPKQHLRCRCFLIPA